MNEIWPAFKKIVRVPLHLFALKTQSFIVRAVQKKLIFVIHKSVLKKVILKGLKKNQL